MNKEKIIRLLETPPVTGRAKDYAGMVDFAKLADMIDQLYQLDLGELQEDLRLARNGYSELKAENIKLKGEVKAGAGMLADMHDKYESASQAKEHERARIMGIIANASYSKPDSLDVILPFNTWQELCRTDGQFLKESK